MSKINYILIIKDKQNDNVTTYGYETHNEAIKAIRQERAKYKSDTSYRGDYSTKKGLSFSTDTIECEIVRTDRLAYGIGRETFIVCIGGDVCNYATSFGKYEDAKKFYDELLTVLRDLTEQGEVRYCNFYDVWNGAQQQQFHLETGVVNVSLFPTYVFGKQELLSIPLRIMVANSRLNLGQIRS